MLNKTDECIICGEPLEYLDSAVTMKCSICGKKQSSKTRCTAGHYVCDECHMSGVDSIIGVCMNETSSDPASILERLMDLPFCHMHGPEHHVMVGSALLTAYKNSGADIDLGAALAKMQNRGRQVPGGACGFWGACGAGISTGMFISIISGTTPLKEDSWGLGNLMTSSALERIGAVGGPRYCKRDSYLAVLAAVDFVSEHFGIEMSKTPVMCKYFGRNNQCIGSRCPFSRQQQE